MVTMSLWLPQIVTSVKIFLTSSQSQSLVSTLTELSMMFFFKYCPESSCEEAGACPSTGREGDRVHPGQVSLTGLTQRQTTGLLIFPAFTKLTEHHFKNKAHSKP